MNARLIHMYGSWSTSSNIKQFDDLVGFKTEDGYHIISSYIIFFKTYTYCNNILRTNRSGVGLQLIFTYL